MGSGSGDLNILLFVVSRHKMIKDKLFAEANEVKINSYLNFHQKLRIRTTNMIELIKRRLFNKDETDETMQKIKDERQELKMMFRSIEQ